MLRLGNGKIQLFLTIIRFILLLHLVECETGFLYWMQVFRIHFFEKRTAPSFEAY